MIVLHDDGQTAKWLCDQMEARVQGRCSECDRPVKRYEVDESARCDRCQP